MNDPIVLVVLNLLAIALGSIVLLVVKGLQSDVRDLREGIHSSSKETDQKIDTSEQKIFRVIELLRSEMKTDMQVMSRKIDSIERNGVTRRGRSE